MCMNLDRRSLTAFYCKVCSLVLSLLQNLCSYGSVWQVEEQPSPSVLLPSSHPSPAVALSVPSPHATAVQLVSHVADSPPSSHVSVPKTSPSPQTPRGVASHASPSPSPSASAWSALASSGQLSPQSRLHPSSSAS